MLLHVLNAGVRALAASVVLGGVLIYATSGLDLSNGALFGVIAIGFFMFWVVFFFMFGSRVPKRQDGRDESELDGATHLALRGRRRRENEESNSSEHSDSGGGGD